MKYLCLASVAALLSAATVSAGPLGPRGDDTCPKGYTMSVYYKTVYLEPSTSATPVEYTAIPSPTPVVESETSEIPSSIPAVVASQVPAAVEQVETSTSSSVVDVSSTEAAQLVALLPTSSAESAAAAETTTAPLIQALAEQTTTQAAAETTAAPVVKAATSSSSSGGDSGKATFYGGNLSGGMCSFTGYSLPSTLFGTAFSQQRWDDSANCGRCVSVTGPNGNSVKAMIVDQCPECESNHLDLFQNAFAELSDISAGIIDINWSYVSCDLDGPLKLKNKEGTSAYWFSMQVVNANDAVTALEVSADGGSSWKSTTRSSYNFFENSSGFGSDTVDVRVTGASGSKVVVKNVKVSGGVEVTASSNL